MATKKTATKKEATKPEATRWLKVDEGLDALPVMAGHVLLRTDSGLVVLKNAKIVTDGKVARLRVVQ